MSSSPNATSNHLLAEPPKTSPETGDESPALQMLLNDEAVPSGHTPKPTGPLARTPHDLLQPPVTFEATAAASGSGSEPISRGTSGKFSHGSFAAQSSPGQAPLGMLARRGSVHGRPMSARMAGIAAISQQRPVSALTRPVSARERQPSLTRSPNGNVVIEPAPAEQAEDADSDECRRDEAAEEAAANEVFGGQDDVPPCFRITKHPALAYTSFGLFSGTNKFRLMCLHFTQWWVFEVFILLVILTNCVVLAMQDPTATTDPLWVTNINYFFTATFTMEMLMKMTALGVIFHKHSYFRVAWNRLDFLIVLLSYLTLAPNVGNFTALRAFRVLRPLRSATVIPPLKRLVDVLLRSLSGLADMLILVFFIFSIFGIFGVQLFSGNLHQRCRDNNSGVVSLTRFCSFTPTTNSVLGSSCPSGSTCVTAVDNPDYGFTSWDNLAAAWLLIVQVLTQKDWTTLMYQIMSTASWFACLYFLALIVLGSYLVLNLALAIISNEFQYAQNEVEEQEAAARAQQELEEQIAMGHAAMLEHRKTTVAVDDNSNPKVQKDPSHPTFPGLLVTSSTFRVAANNNNPPPPDPNDSGELPDERQITLEPNANNSTGPELLKAADPDPTIGSDRGSGNSSVEERLLHPDGSPSDRPFMTPRSDDLVPFAEETDEASGQAGAAAATPEEPPGLFSRFRMFVLEFVEGDAEMRADGRITWFGRFIVVCIILNTAVLAADYYGETDTQVTVSRYANLAFAICFTIEMVLKLFGMGYTYFLDPMNCFDGFIVCIGWVEIGLGGASQFSVLRAFRLLRIFKLLKAFPSLLAIIDVIVFAIKDTAALNVLIVLYLFIAALLGMQLFGGAFPDSDDSGAIRERYDSIAEAALVVFQLLTRDNWVLVMHRSMRYTSAAAALYYIVCIVVGNLIILNLFLAVVISSFTKVGTELEKKQAAELAALEKAQKRHRAPITLSDGLHGRITVVEDVQLGNQTVGQKRDLSRLETNRPIENLLFHSGNVLNDAVKEHMAEKAEVATTLSGDSDIVEVTNFGLSEAIAVAKGSHNRGRKITGVCSRCHDPIYVPFPTASKDIKAPTPEELHDKFCDRIQVRKAKERVMQRLNREITTKQLKSPNPQPPTATYVEEFFGRAWEVGLLLGEDFEDHVRNPSFSRLREALKEEEAIVDLRVGEDQFGWALVAYTRANVPSETATNGGVSLFLLGRKNPFRVWCTSVVTHPLFDAFIMLCIFVSSILIVFDDPRQPNSDTNSNLETVGDIFTVVFVIEMVMKILAFGLVLHPSAYLRDPWNALDCFIVIISVLAWALRNVTNVGILKILRTFRALRPLRLINKNRGLKMVVITLLRSFKGIANVALITLIIWLVFAILGTQLFGGSLYKCNDSTIADHVNCVGYYYPNGKPTPRSRTLTLLPVPNATVSPPSATSLVTTLPPGAAWRSWIAFDYNFDNTYESLITLLVVATLDDWSVIMRDVVDSTSHDTGPRRNANLYYALYFVVFITIGSFFFLAFFVGVVIFQYNIAKDSLDGLSFLSPEQKHWVETQRMVLNFRPNRRNRPPNYEGPQVVATQASVVDAEVEEQKLLIKDEVTGAFVLREDHATVAPEAKVDSVSVWMLARLWAFNIVETYAFELTTGGLVVINIIIIAMYHYNQSSQWDDLQYNANILFVSIFTAEMVLKVFALGFVQYFRSGWNDFDFLLVVIGLVTINSSFGLPINPNTFRVLRMFRILRLLTLFKKANGVRMLLETIYYSLPSLGNISVFLGLVFFLFSVLGVQLFANVKADGLGIDDQWANFHHFGNAFLMLTRIATLDNWGYVMAATTNQQNCGPTDNGYAVVDTCGVVYAPVYYVIFIILTSFVLINVFVAIILDNFNTTMKLNHSEVNVQDLKRFSDAWERFDADATMLMETRHFPSLLCALKPPLGLARRSDRVGILKTAKELTIPEHGGVIHFAETLIPLARAVQNVEFSAADIRDHEDGWKQTFPNLRDLPVLRFREVRITVDQYIAATYMQAARRRKLAQIRIDYLRREKERDILEYYERNHVSDEQRTAVHRLQRKQQRRMERRSEHNKTVAALAAEAAAEAEAELAAKEEEATKATMNSSFWLPVDQNNPPAPTAAVAAVGVMEASLQSDKPPLSARRTSMRLANTATSAQ